MKELFGKFRDFFLSPSYSQTLLLVGLFILLLAIPVTVAFLGQQTNTQQHAYVPPGDGVCTSVAGQPVPGTSKTCCGTNYCQLYYSNSTCGEIQKIVETNVCACNYAGTKTVVNYQACNGGQLCIQYKNSCSGAISYDSCNTVAGRCDVAYPTPTPTACQKAGGTCYTNNSCGAGQHEISESCQTGYRICCASGAPTPHYDCQNNSGATNNGIYKHTTDPNSGSTPIASCQTNQTCSGGPVFQEDNKFDINAIKQTLCHDVSICPNFAFDNQQFPNGTCKDAASIWAPKCTTTQYYVLSNIGYGAFQCTYTPPGTPSTGTGSTTAVCTAGSAKGNCYTNNSCGANMDQFDSAVSTCNPSRTSDGRSFRICCVPKSGSTGPGGGENQCTNGKQTQFAVNIKLPGIGTGQFENHTPANLTKHGSLVVKDSNGVVKNGQEHDFSHSYGHENGNGKLKSEHVDLGSSKYVCGQTYHVEVKIPGYVTVKKNIVYGEDQTLDISENDIIAGDIVSAGTDNIVVNGKVIGDDKVTIADYNIFKTCHENPNQVFTFTSNTQKIDLKCSDLINLFDFQDGGAGVDANGISEFADNYNLWLRGYIKANGY